MSHHKAACRGCGCNCRDCSDNVSSLHLHVEIENLKQRLLEKENHIVTMETNFLREADKFPNGEMAALTDELLTWQDKYSRLYEAHKRVQKVNQNLEDKLLRIVDKCETEKNLLSAEVTTLTRRLVDEKFNVNKLMEENERYRNDVNLAIQLLQCKPANFVPQKYDSLPIDLQQKVRSYVSSKRRMSVSDTQQKQPEMKTIKVPIPTFPPTAMVYSVNKSNDEKDGNSGSCGEEKNNRQGSMDIVSAAIMAKVLEEREKERSRTKHCDTCTCSTVVSVNDQANNNNRHHNKETQTVDNCNNLFFNEPNICYNNSNSDSSSKSNNNGSISYISGTNLNNHNSYKTMDSSSKILRNSSNYSINNSMSSPMNVKRSKNVPVSINHPVRSSLSEVFEPKKEPLNQTDYFSDFNMISALDERDNSAFNNRGSKSDKNNLSESHNQSCNKLSCLTDVMTAGKALSVDNKDVSQVNDNLHRNNKAVLGNNHKNCNNNVNFSSEPDDECNNLIIFDKQPVLLPKISTNTLTLPSTTTAIANTTGNSILAPATTTLTVLGGNLNINSTSIGNRSGSARHCSVRLQEGSSNILLDNVVDGPYAPVLYKSRQQPIPDPLLVHIPPSRSLSASSSVSSCNDDQRNPTDIISNVNCPLQPMSFSSSSSSSSSTSSSSLTTSSHKNLILAQLRTETEI